jgi:hypothetical protein
MKILRLLAIPCIALAIMAFSNTNELKELEIGQVGPMFDYKMDDISGVQLSLNDVKGENGTLLIFSCNTCPFVHAWEDRYLTIAELAREHGIGLVLVNPNEDIRDKGESLQDNIDRAKMIGYTFPYTIDTDHRLADAYGATRTPHVYLMDKNNVLVFRGAIDDNSRSAADVEKTYLADAIRELANGHAVTTKTSRAIGCTIKRS